jgi:hypothetical protein
MPEHRRHIFNRPAGEPPELGGGVAQSMGRHARHADRARVSAQVLGEASSGDLEQTVSRIELRRQPTFTGQRAPQRRQRGFRHDAPALAPSLHVAQELTGPEIHVASSHAERLRASQPTEEDQQDDGSITSAPGRVRDGGQDSSDRFRLWTSGKWRRRPGATDERGRVAVDQSVPHGQLVEARDRREADADGRS